MMNVAILLAASLLLSAMSAQPPTPSGTEFRVRLVDVRDAHPYADRKVWVQFHVPQTPELQTLEETTGTDGVAIFHLPAPAPKTVAAHLASDGLYYCFRTYPIDTDQVIKEGLVDRCTRPPQSCACKFSKQIDATQPRPGEVVLPARPFTRWERFLGHIWE